MWATKNESNRRAHRVHRERTETSCRDPLGTIDPIYYCAESGINNAMQSFDHIKFSLATSFAPGYTVNAISPGYMGYQPIPKYQAMAEAIFGTFMLAAFITTFARKYMRQTNLSAGNGIRTHEHLRDWTLNPAPLTWLGNPRKRCRHSHAVVVFNSIRSPARPPLRNRCQCLLLLPTSSTWMGIFRRSSSTRSSSMNTPLPPRVRARTPASARLCSRCLQ